MLPHETLLQPRAGVPSIPPEALETPLARQEPRSFFRSLSAKLLALSALFVIVGQIVVFLPSVASFRLNWLTERLTAAQIAALAVEAAPNNAVPDALRDELLRSARVHAVAVVRDNARFMILQSHMPEAIGEHFDLRRATPFDLVRDALGALTATGDAALRVTGESPFRPGAAVEIVISRAPLTAALLDFARGVAGLTLLVLLVTAIPVYIALDRLFIRPVARMTRAMERFSAAPENTALIIAPSQRRDEVGTAERELAAMQRTIASLLRQKSRLAALGLAVAKVNHDLRNMLATSQLISDRLARVPDKTVQQVMPKLVNSLDRAIALCTETLRYGRADVRAPVLQRTAVRPMAIEAAEALGLSEGASSVALECTMPSDFEVDADPAHLYRMLLNLMRNAKTALEEAGTPLPKITLSAERNGAMAAIIVADNGSGVPEGMRPTLFQPFQPGKMRSGGGVGLGLAICSELAVAHGGSLTLQPGSGAEFRIELPDRPGQQQGFARVRAVG